MSEDVTTDFAQKDALGRVSRKPKLTAHQVEMAHGLLESGKPPRDVAKSFGVGRSTLYRVLKLMDDSVMVASEAEEQDDPQASWQRGSNTTNIERGCHG